MRKRNRESENCLQAETEREAQRPAQSRILARLGRRNPGLGRARCFPLRPGLEIWKFGDFKISMKAERVLSPTAAVPKLFQARRPHEIRNGSPEAHSNRGAHAP